MTLIEGIVLALGGAASGFINTLAGGGSAITIPILEGIVGIQSANGTNRIAILLANLSALAGFQRGKAVPWQRVWPLLPPAVIGAALGAWLATQADPELLKVVFGVVILGVAASVLVRPARWVAERESSLGEPWRSVAFFAIGFYGGFVQAGVGFLLLAGLVLGGGLDLVRGNAAKVVVIPTYTVVALFFFLQANQVDLAVGAVLSVGQMSGAWIAAHLAIVKGAAWVRWILVAAAVVAAIRLLFFA